MKVHKVQRAQVSFEFFTFLGLAFLIAIAFEYISLNQLNDFRLKEENEVIKDISLKLQKELLIAAYVEDGYVRMFTIPDKIGEINYSLTTQNSTLIVQSKNSAYILSLPNYAGNLSKGTNKINKTGGVIYVN